MLLKLFYFSCVGYDAMVDANHSYHLQIDVQFL